MLYSKPLLELFRPFFLQIFFNENFWLAIAQYLFILFIFFTLYALIKASAKLLRIIDSHWHHMFDFIPFGTQDFYDAVTNEINNKGIEGLSFSNITYREAGMLSANRLYLRVKYKDYKMDICAAPFASEAFFVSWWLGHSGFKLRDILSTIPFFGRLFSKREKTFYEYDTEIMFKEMVSKSVKDTIEHLTDLQGNRQFISDWKGTDLVFNK